MQQRTESSGPLGCPSLIHRPVLLRFKLAGTQLLLQSHFGLQAFEQVIQVYSGSIEFGHDPKQIPVMRNQC